MRRHSVLFVWILAGGCEAASGPSDGGADLATETGDLAVDVDAGGGDLAREVGDLADVGDGGCAPRPAPECTPVVHRTMGYVADLTVQRYRIVAASRDGRRIGVLFSHFGPASQDPFANVFGYEEGNPKPLFQVSRFQYGAGQNEAALTAVEEATLAEAAPLFREQGIDALAEPPAPLPWCRNGDEVAVGCEAARFTWSDAEGTCPPNGGRRTTMWRLCDEGGACVSQMHDANWDCQTGELSLVDLYDVSGVRWVVAGRRVVFLDPLFLHTRLVGGKRP